MFIGLSIDQRVMIASCNMKLFSNVTGSQRVITSYHHNLITKHTHAHVVLMANILGKTWVNRLPPGNNGFWSYVLQARFLPDASKVQRNQLM